MATEIPRLHDIIFIKTEKGPVVAYTKRSLKRIPDEQLDEAIRRANDLWVWDSGKPQDKIALEALEAERKFRKEQNIRVEKVKSNNGQTSITRVKVRPEEAND